jgi:hypothetical protein
MGTKLPTITFHITMATWELQLLFFKNLFWVHTNQGVSLLAIALHGCLATIKATPTPPPHPFFFPMCVLSKQASVGGKFRNTIVLLTMQLQREL